jgi:heme-degrading monooxygenase HmoA
MATMLVQQQVKDFAEWKKVYDSVAKDRASRGGLSAQVYQDVDDPNHVTIIGKWRSLDDARKWADSPTLKAAVEKAGVDSMPVFTFLNEA